MTEKDELAKLVANLEVQLKESKSKLDMCPRRKRPARSLKRSC